MFSSRLILLVISGILCVVHSNDDIESAFSEWTKTYSKTYESAKEEDLRKLVWARNLKFVKEHNANFSLGLSSFSVRMNEFADLTSLEFNEIYKGAIPQKPEENVARHVLQGIVDDDDSLDWRKSGCVTPVKSQGRCGSCWAFSAVVPLEAAHFFETGEIVDISEQNLVDCCGPEGTAGCQGGWMNSAFLCVNREKGIDDEKTYPYKANDGKCVFKLGKSVQRDYGFVAIKEGCESALKDAVKNVGPVCVAVDASQASFRLYSGGVYDEPLCKNNTSDHAMAIVGYGKTPGGKEYWIVKNSWGDWWGENGYILMSRNKNNQCAIATYASYPEIKKPKTEKSAENIEQDKEEL